jgi:hypothetical protein
VLVGSRGRQGPGESLHHRQTTITEAAYAGEVADGLKLISDPRRETVLGAHAVGEDALEVIQAIATAMAVGIDIATLARLPFAYPTYTPIIATAATPLLGDAVPPHRDPQRPGPTPLPWTPSHTSWRHHLFGSCGLLPATC